MSYFSQTIALFVSVGLIAMLAGCGTLLRNPVPPELTAEARIPDMPEVRAWAGRVSPAMERDFAQSFQQESPARISHAAPMESSAILISRCPEAAQTALSARDS
jgi:hypothetical protein